MTRLGGLNVMNLKEAMDCIEKLQDDKLDLNKALKLCGRWNESSKSEGPMYDDFMIELHSSSRASIKSLLKSLVTTDVDLDHVMCGSVICHTGAIIKMDDATERVHKLITDCEDLKDAMLRIGNWTPSCVESAEEFIKNLQDSKRVSVEVLLSSLALLEEELRLLLDSEVKNGYTKIDI